MSPFPFSSVGLTGLAQRTVERFVEQASRLYESRRAGTDAVRIPGAPGFDDGDAGQEVAWGGATVADASKKQPWQQ